MKSVIERVSIQIKDKKTLILTALVILFDAIIYLIRGGGDEFSLFMEALGILVVFFCAFLIVLIGISILMTGFLIFKVIQHGIRKDGSLIPLISLVIGAVLAFNLPLPSLAEEASFIKYQKDYKHIVDLAKSKQLEHGNGCNADSPSSYAFKVPAGYEHLSEDCIFVHYYSGNINVEFSPYNYAVALNYFENPNDVTKSRDCDFRGYVWKKINENWYVCKLSHTW